jgi:ribosomal-protein-alanine N-acetyltransferase
MIRRDMPAVELIESDVFEFPWTELDFVRCLRQRDCIGMVVEFNSEPVGYMVYELHPNSLNVLNFAVHREFQRMGAGSEMVQRLISKLAPERRNRIVLQVRETNLPAQLFFRSCGFRALGMLREHYQETGEDAIVMQYRLADQVGSRAVSVGDSGVCRGI